MRFLDIAFKDLIQILRDWRAAAFLIAAPILFTVLMGFMMGGWNTNGTEDTRLEVGVLDRDGGILSMQFAALLERSEILRPVLLAEADFTEAGLRVTKGELAAAMIFPQGYSAGILAGNEIPIEIVSKKDGSAGSTAERALQGLVTRFMGALESARLATDAFTAKYPFGREADRMIFLTDALIQSLAAWQNPPVTTKIVAGKTAAADKQGIPSGFAQASPGNMVTFALAGLISAAEILVIERKSGTLNRLLTTSIPRLGVLAGHFIAMCTLVFIQVILLGVVGQLAFGLPYLRAPIAFLVISGAVTLWIGGMGLLIGVLARTAEQVAMLAIAPMLALAGLGGAWMPLEVTGQTFQAIGRLTPTARAMQGMQNIILRGQGLEGVLLPAGVLLLFAAAFIGLAVWKFQTR